MKECGLDLVSSSEKDIARQMKEAKCYVAVDFDAEIKKFKEGQGTEAEYEMPDGQIIKLGDQQFRAPEVLFNPGLIGKEAAGIAEMTYQTIRACDIDLRSQLYKNLVLSGGTTMFPGIADRLKAEIERLAPGNCKVKVNASPERKYSVWIGGALLASLGTFQGSWVTRAEYDEHGPGIIHRKCF